MKLATQYTYLLINFFTIVVPFVFSFHPKLRFWSNIKAFVPANLIVSLVFIIWDALFTKIGVWWFNEQYLLGIYILGLPLEEILFFLCIPYACLFSYHCFGVWRQNQLRSYPTRIISLALLLFGAVFILVYPTRIYTFVNFTVMNLFILYVAFLRPKKWLGQLYFTYLIMILPFLVVNGILTGTGLDQAIVNYNPHEFVGFRILTIPFEDTFYGFTLIGLNVFLYERFLESRTPAERDY